MDADGYFDSIVLREQCPWSTPAERCRFLAAKGNENAAVDQLLKYHSWLCDHEIDTTVTPIEHSHSGCSSHSQTNDSDSWHTAVVDTNRFSIYSHCNNIQRLPRIGRSHCNSCRELRTRDEQRIFQFFPAQLDQELASIEVYTSTIALYLFRKLNRYSLEKIVVLVDVRAGHGWKNPSPYDCIPFIKYLSRTFEQIFPERLSLCIIYPLPWGSEFLWTLIRRFIDPASANKIVIISGSASRNAPPPNLSLSSYIDDETLERLEHNRTSSFGK